MRREIRLGRDFDASSFERAFARFREMYNVAPHRASCAPDVLLRYCELFERSEHRALEHSARLRYDGVPLVAGILPPGIIAFEGEVDEDRMGDW